MSILRPGSKSSMSRTTKFVLAGAQDLLVASKACDAAAIAYQQGDYEKAVGLLQESDRRMRVVALSPLMKQMRRERAGRRTSP